MASSEAPSRVPADEPVALVASEVGPSVVQVNVRAVRRTPLGTQRGEGIGSGVIYRPGGYIITNNHVVEDTTGVNVAFADGTTEAARVVGADPDTEIAVLRVNRDDLPAATFSEERPHRRPARCGHRQSLRLRVDRDHGRGQRRGPRASPRAYR